MGVVKTNDIPNLSIDSKPASHKNDALHQRTTYCHIYWPYRLRKKSSCFRLDKKKYSRHFDYITIICPTLRWNKTYAKAWIKHDDKV